MDYEKATLADAPAITKTIHYLRGLETDKVMKTGKAQSSILRAIAPEVLAEVARLLSLQEGAR